MPSSLALQFVRRGFRQESDIVNGEHGFNNDTPKEESGARGVTIAYPAKTELSFSQNPMLGTT